MKQLKNRPTLDKIDRDREDRTLLMQINRQLIKQWMVLMSIWEVMASKTMDQMSISVRKIMFNSMPKLIKRHLIICQSTQMINLQMTIAAKSLVSIKFRRY